MRSTKRSLEVTKLQQRDQIAQHSAATLRQYCIIERHAAADADDVRNASEADQSAPMPNPPWFSPDHARSNIERSQMFFWETGLLMRAIAQYSNAQTQQPLTLG